MMAMQATLVVELLAMVFLPQHLGSSLLTHSFVVLLLVLAYIDFLTYKVPNLLLYPSIAFIVIGTALVDPAMLAQALFGGGVMLAIMFVLAIVGRGKLGMGDVKFATFIGLALGWWYAILAVAMGFVFGAVAAVILMALGRKGREDALPLTPFLAIGATVTTYMYGTLVG
jgi:leader peptidase (prepilin peptidase)/N-methyltransferase